MDSSKDKIKINKNIEILIKNKMLTDRIKYKRKRKKEELITKLTKKKKRVRTAL